MFNQNPPKRSSVELYVPCRCAAKMNAKKSCLIPRAAGRHNYPTSGVTAVHTIHFPVSARQFVLPLVAHLNGNGFATELWFENQPQHAAVIRQITGPQRHLNMDLTPNIATLGRRVRQFRNALREARPTVLHCHQTRAAVVPLLAGWMANVPVRIYHNHGLPYLGHRGAMRLLLRQLEWINIHLATHVLLVSHSNLAAARADGLLKAGQGRVLAHGSAAGIDLRDYAPDRFNREAQARARHHWGIGQAGFVLGYVGRPVRRKGFHRLLRSWEQSGLSQQGGILLLAGCTREQCATALRRQVAGVIALGYLTDLREFYAAGDAVVLPSDHEGFPYSLLEGAAASRPLIGTDLPGLRCAVHHETTGLLVRPRDEAALGQAITRLAQHPELRHQWGRNARTRVEREFDRPRVLENLVEYYRTGLGVVPSSPALQPVNLAANRHIALTVAA